MRMTGTNRAAHAAVALFAATGLALHFVVVLGRAGEVAVRTLRFFSYFTILTNLLILVSALAMVLAKGRLAAIVARPGWRTAVTSNIIVVALIYHVLLRDIVLPGAMGWWANMLVHQLVPVAWTLCWLAFPPHGGIDRIAPLRWLLYPLCYGAWTLLHGAVAGWYPYPFIDVAAFGYPTVLQNLAVVALLFAALGYALRWADTRLAHRKRDWR